MTTIAKVDDKWDFDVETCNEKLQIAKDALADYLKIKNDIIGSIKK